jgi:hypothetical protein
MTITNRILVKKSKGNTLLGISRYRQEKKLKCVFNSMSTWFGFSWF